MYHTVSMVHPLHHVGSGRPQARNSSLPTAANNLAAFPTQTLSERAGEFVDSEVTQAAKICSQTQYQCIDYSSFDVQSVCNIDIRLQQKFTEQ